MREVGGKILKGQTKNFLDQEIQRKKMVPSPSQYSIEVSPEKKKVNNPMVSKRPRITLTDEIIRSEKKRKNPSVG